MRERSPMTDAVSSTIPGAVRRGDRKRTKARHELDNLMIIYYPEGKANERVIR